jgi:hypothetical protein
MISHKLRAILNGQLRGRCSDIGLHFYFLMYLLVAFMAVARPVQLPQKNIPRLMISNDLSGNVSVHLNKDRI